MKKITLLLLLISISLNSFSQFTKVSEKNIVGKVNNFEITKDNNLYYIEYNDLKFTKIDAFKQFTLNKEEFTTLFNLIEKGLKETPKKPIIIENVDLILSIEFVKMMGVRSVQLTHTDKSSGIIGLTRYLTKKQVLKVFNKKKEK